MTNSIRPIAVALIRRPSDGALLVTAHGRDTDDVRVRPLGGGIEFGETARAALDREMVEELGTTVESATLLTVFENIFVSDGVTGHEVVFAFECTLADDTIGDRDHFPVLDAPDEIAFWWRPGDDGARLVPPELDEFVSSAP